MSDINSIASREIVKAVTAILESKMSSDGDDERRRQERMAKAVQDRGIVSDGEKKAKEQSEAEEETKDDSEKKREDRTGGKGTADSRKLKVPKEEVLKAPTLGSVIDKLNALRGGKSLKDKEVRESFEQYFEGLDKSERQSLLAFLTGIAQILSGVEKGSDALEPKDVGVKSKGSKSDPSIEPKKSDQKGTADSPIVVGEKRDYDIQRALSSYRKYNEK